MFRFHFEKNLRIGEFHSKHGTKVQPVKKFNKEFRNVYQKLKLIEHEEFENCSA